MAATLQVYQIPRVSTGSPAPQPAVQQKRPEYLFIHTVRFWSMVAIVLLHCGFELGALPAVPQKEIFLLVQPFKFGTIAFFVISGFLLGDRLPASNPLGYLRRRVQRLVPAWIVWYVLWFLYAAHADLQRAGFTSSIGHLAIIYLTETPLWFVPNFLVALTCLVLLRRWLNDLRLGAFLLAVNIFYGVNVYYCWLPSRHTEALFAFVFYLWLGAWCGLRKESIQAWARARSPWWLGFWACVATGVAGWERMVLRWHGNPDPLNTLRFGNQIYSILIVILLVRIQGRSWPSFVKVAETTYGIYLTHEIILKLVFHAVTRIVRGRVLGFGGVLLMWVILSPLVYFLSFQLTRTIASSDRWKWLVGAADFEPRKLIARAALPGTAVTTSA